MVLFTIKLSPSLPRVFFHVSGTSEHTGPASSILKRFVVSETLGCIVVTTATGQFADLMLNVYEVPKTGSREPFPDTDLASSEHTSELPCAFR